MTWRLPSNAIDQQVSYHFDTRGRMDSVTDPRGTTTYGFDIESRVTQITMPEGQLNYEYDQTNGWHTRTYVVNNNITGNNGATNEDTTYSYDQAGRLEKVTAVKLGNATSSLVTTYGYSEAGLLTTVLRKNGASQIARTVNNYDILNRLQKVTLKDNADAAFMEYTYTRRSDGKISHVLEKQLGGGPTTGDVNRDFTYDTLGRLKTEMVDQGFGGAETTSYNYDLVGNRLQKSKSGFSGQVIDYLYDARDRLQTETDSFAGATSYSYDANGSQTLKNAQGTANDETYTWDARNRLSGAAVTRNGAAVTTQYKYDDSGIRTQQVETTTPQFGQPTTVTRKQLVDGMTPTGYAQVIEETEGGVLKVSTVYGLEPVAQKDSSGTSIYLADGHSGTRYLLNVLGQVLQQYSYDAFGNLQGTLPSGVANPILYRGERFDATLQNYYLRARYYNPATGRFTSPDPIASSKYEAHTHNRYLYVHNNPIMYIDPNGTFESLSSFQASFAAKLNVISLNAAAILGAYLQVTTLIDFMKTVHSVITQVIMPLINGQPIPMFNIADFGKIFDVAYDVLKTINVREALLSLAFTLPTVLEAATVPWAIWASSNWSRVKSWAIYMPTPLGGMHVPLIPIPLLELLGKGVGLTMDNRGGTLVGVGLVVKQGGANHKQIWRMDYHIWNKSHGKNTGGINADELTTIRDGAFHYHVMKPPS